MRRPVRRKMVSLEYLWPTLRCRREAGVSLLLSIGWWYLSSASPKRHCCRVRAADKGCRVYPLDPRPDAVALYSGCTPGKRRAWFLPDDRHTASLVGLRGGWRHARMKFSTRIYGSNATPFAIQKALVAIGGEPKSVKRLRSGDLLIETISALQTKSFLLAKTFLDSPVSVSPHKSLNTCRGVISEPDLLTIPDAEILEGFSDQAVIQCQRFGHSQTSCRGHLTCSRCATVGNSTDCTLEPKCINCSQPHSADSKLCSRWKTEKQIQDIKTNRNITYLEAQKLITPPISQSYDAQATKSSKVSATTQTDENITKIKCPPLKLLQQPSSLPNISPSIPSTCASSALVDLLTSSSSIAAISESESVNPIPNNVSSTSNTSAFPSNSPLRGLTSFR
ncbi:uncharacterized protein TNCV_1341581 [Trichonephila clavipes]|uniref:Uncharacterized protein n=1 Tax=Trichonephila clavipes TaxID=2585209 RepID=A0A8X6RW86_TRICX|nr:uncharacterized protein TNCV_1341581 [Trichonephila clavipes]